MSGFEIVDSDFYLKKGITKPLSTPVEFLLSHEAAVSLAHDVEHFVFVSSHRKFLEIWQVTDLNVLEVPIPDVVGTVDELLAGELSSDRYICGRLFKAADSACSEESKAEVTDVLVRARWPFEVQGSLTREGLVSRHEWQSALRAFEKAIAENKKNARARQRENPSQVVRVAKRLRLDPQPYGDSPHKWQARCPGKSHPVYISTSSDLWFCGWCKRNGGPEELEAFHAERSRKAS